MSSTIAVNGLAATRVSIHVPRVGVWYADVDFADDAPDLPATPFGCAITIDGATFVGTRAPKRDGTFGLQRRTRILGGAAGWQTLAPSRADHNDAGVKGSFVAQAVAGQVGEKLPDASAIGARLGVDYVRPEGVASRVLEDACRGIPWRVDYDGVTRVGARTPPVPVADDYTVISHDPRHGQITLALDDVSKVGIGTVLTAGLDAPATVTALEIAATADSLRMLVWAGQGASTALIDTLRAIVERLIDRRLDGIYRYRVIGMNSDRADLQRCGSRKDLPNTIATSMWPGVSGSHAKLARGCEVLVQFIDGDRAQPAITGFVGRGGPGDIPEELTLGGPSGAAPVACLGDSVTVYFPPTIAFTGTVAGAPASGVLTILTPSVGIIESGRPHVLAGNGK